MSRRTLTVSPAASRELATILGIIAEKAGARVATRWRKTFGTRMRALVRQPYLGATDEDLGPGRRRLVLAPYLIVYEIGPGNEIGILRIVHGARDLPTMFDDLP